jgi:hypothetical protein
LYQGPLLMSNQVEKKKKRLKEWEKNWAFKDVWA